MDKLERLKKYAEFEREHGPPCPGRHITEWAVEEIERLRAVAVRARDTMEGPCDCGSDCPQCRLFRAAVRALEDGEAPF